MVEEVFELILHISLHMIKLTHFLDIYENMSIFLIFNHKFPFNTKINDLENNKVKPIFNYENGIMKG